MEIADISPDLIGELSLQLIESGEAHGSAAEWNGTELHPPFSRLYFALDGDAFVGAPQGNRTPLPAGTCCLLPAGVSFCYGCETSMRQLYFHLLLQRDGVCDVLAGQSRILFAAADPGLILRAQKLMAQPSLSARLELQALLLGVLAGLLPPAPAAAREPASACVRLAVQRIQAGPTMRLNAAFLAAAAPVSPSTLTHLFRREMGQSLHDAIENAVFARAQQLLRQKEKTIAEISDELGFCDPFYFSRRFRKRYGKSPREFRRQNSL